MVEKDIHEEKALMKKVFQRIAKWYLIIGIILMLIGFTASGIDYFGIIPIRSNMVLSVVFGFLLILGAILLVQGVFFVILGIAKKENIRIANRSTQ